MSSLVHSQLFLFLFYSPCKFPKSRPSNHSCLCHSISQTGLFSPELTVAKSWWKADRRNDSASMETHNVGIQRCTQNYSNNHLYLARSMQVISHWLFPLIARECSMPRVLLSLSKPVPAYLWLKARSKEGFIRCPQWFLYQYPRLQSKNTLLNRHLTNCEGC